jgi:hypothetical protein
MQLRAVKKQKAKDSDSAVGENQSIVKGSVSKEVNEKEVVQSSNEVINKSLNLEFEFNF